MRMSTGLVDATRGLRPGRRRIEIRSYAGPPTLTRGPDLSLNRFSRTADSHNQPDGIHSTFPHGSSRCHSRAARRWHASVLRAPVVDLVAEHVRRLRLAALHVRMRARGPHDAPAAVARRFPAELPHAEHFCLSFGLPRGPSLLDLLDDRRVGKRRRVTERPLLGDVLK